MDSWLDKYKPVKISDISTNLAASKAIQAWLHDYDKMRVSKDEKKVKGQKKNKNIKSCMTISGNHGIGKTTTVNVILKDLGYSAINLDIDALKNSKNIEATIKKILKETNIMKILVNTVQTKQKHAIIVDELEGISGQTEKTSLIQLQRLNDQNWYCPIIFIMNSQHNKFMSDIKKASLEVKMWPPYDSELEKILLKISNNENIQIKHKSVANKIIMHSQYDIRRLVTIMEDLKNTYSGKVILPEMMEEYCFSSNSKKDTDIDLYKATNELIYNYESVDNCLRLFETEKVLLPLMMQQNYIVALNNKKSNYDLYLKISDLLSFGDVIENYIYGDQNWGMEDIHGFYTCAATSYYLHNNTQQIKPKLIFATDLNKTSIKKINKKNIINADKCFINMNISDYIYLGKLVRHLISKNNIEECVKIMKNYNIKLEHIESLLKIDKIEGSKSGLSAKQKTEFSNFLLK